MQHHRSLSDRLVDGINILLLVFVASIMLFPFINIFSTSFATMNQFLTEQFILWPKEWVLDAYRYILSSDSFVRSIYLTIYITVVGTFVNLVLTSTMAYGLTRGIKGQRFILFMVLFTIVFQAGMIPTYLVVKETGLINTTWSLILPTAIASFNLIVIRQFFTNIPSELNEAALIDGANELQIFYKIILPLSKPALAAFGLFYAVQHWNRYFEGVLYLNDPAKYPIQVILRQIVVVEQMDAALSVEEMMRNTPPPQTIQMAAVLVATIPILFVYPFLQKHFAKGVLIGSVKG